MNRYGEVVSVDATICLNLVMGRLQIERERGIETYVVTNRTVAYAVTDVEFISVLEHIEYEYNYPLDDNIHWDKYLRWLIKGLHGIPLEVRQNE